MFRDVVAKSCCHYTVFINEISCRLPLSIVCGTTFHQGELVETSGSSKMSQDFLHDEELVPKFRCFHSSENPFLEMQWIRCSRFRQMIVYHPVCLDVLQQLQTHGILSHKLSSPKLLTKPSAQLSRGSYLRVLVSPQFLRYSHCVSYLVSWLF